jgi:hypothetical protein
LTRDDVNTWYRLHKLGAAVQMDEVELADRLFQGAETLRHRPFAQQLRPLLGLAPKDSTP